MCQGTNVLDTGGELLTRLFHVAYQISCNICDIEPEPEPSNYLSLSTHPPPQHLSLHPTVLPDRQLVSNYVALSVEKITLSRVIRVLSSFNTRVRNTQHGKVGIPTSLVSRPVRMIAVRV